MGENPNATGIETNCFTDTVWGIKPLARRTNPKKLWKMNNPKQHPFSLLHATQLLHKTLY